MTPTQRTLKLLRELGWHAEVVERWIPKVNIRKDLFGFVDIVGVRERSPFPLWVQTCSGTDHAKRVSKMREQPAFAACTRCGMVVIVSWSKVNDRTPGARKLWRPRVEAVNGDRAIPYDLSMPF